jgi:hypothetical protein
LPKTEAGPVVHPPGEAPAIRKSIADLLGPDIARVLGEARHVELYQVAVPTNGRLTDLSRYNVISQGVELTDEEVEQLRQLLLQDPALYLPASLVRTCPAQPEFMLDARNDRAAGSFETVQIVLSRSCMAIRFMLDKDPARSRGIIYYDERAQPALDDFVMRIRSRSEAQSKEPPPPMPPHGSNGAN